MSNMTVNQRNQIEGAAYSGSDERIRRGSERGAAIYSVIALIIGAALCVAALSVINGWAQWLVLGAIVVTVIGFMIAISPRRQGW
jgi:VIT1/CCC1 family predicted Fe2+/Mn2+ transporter